MLSVVAHILDDFDGDWPWFIAFQHLKGCLEEAEADIAMEKSQDSDFCKYDKAQTSKGHCQPLIRISQCQSKPHGDAHVCASVKDNGN